MQRGTDGRPGPGGKGGPRWGWTHRYAMPMFVTSLIAVALAGAGLIAVTVFEVGAGLADGDRGPGGDPTDGPGGDPTEEPGRGGPGTDPPAGIDPCVVGTWQVVTHRETLPLIDETVQLVEGGAVTVFHADGTGTTDYGDGMRLAGGNDVVVDFSGTVDFEYEAASGTFRYLSQESHATLRLTVAGLSAGSQDVIYRPEPAGYECDEDVLRFDQEEQSYQGEYQRVDS